VIGKTLGHYRIDERDSSVIYFHVEPICDPLRTHPRFHALLRKMNLG